MNTPSPPATDQNVAEDTNDDLSALMSGKYR